MRIATIGTGAMASALAPGWAAAGHELLIGGRSSARAEALAAVLGPPARSAGLQDAVDSVR